MFAENRDGAGHSAAGDNRAFHWHIVTGEYPPQPGGVADYSRLVADALSQAGDQVEVWAPRAGFAPEEQSGRVVIHRLPGNFGLRALIALQHRLRWYPSARILLQWVPHAFGWKAMNLPLCLWLYAKRRHPVTVVFHEVAVSVVPGMSPRNRLRARVTQLMARLVAGSASRALIASPWWERSLRALSGSRLCLEWVPVPSNVPIADDPQATRAVRGRLLAGKPGTIIGHFGTGHPEIVAGVEAAAVKILAARADSVALIMGFGTDRVAAKFKQKYPSLAARIHGVGALSHAELSVHLQACDLMLQPYHDGVTTRRGSMMACISHGLAVVTYYSSDSEDLWREGKAVALAPVGDEAALVEAALQLLSDPDRRGALGRAAAGFYQKHCSLERVIEALRKDTDDQQRAGKTVTVG